MKPLVIRFKAKPEKIWFGETPRLRVKVPEIGRQHCDMDAFRTSRRFGSYANSGLFPAILARALQSAFVPRYLYADEPAPTGITVDKSGFLWSVEILLSDTSS